MGRTQRFPNRLPNAVLVIRIWRIGNRLTRPVIHSELGDLISARAILRIAKARMVRIELNDVIAAGRNFVGCRYRSRVNVVGKQVRVFVSTHILLLCRSAARQLLSRFALMRTRCPRSRPALPEKLNRPAILHSEGPLAGWETLSSSYVFNSRQPIA